MIDGGAPEPAMERGATLSNCDRYRYRLWRTWDERQPPALFVMLNPSTADAEHDDPTIKKCIGFARRWGLGGIRVCNLYAWRATDPKELPAGREAIGEYVELLSINDEFLRQEAERARRIIVAWGATPGPVKNRAGDVARLLRNYAPWHRAEALKLTKAGHPWHPLYIPYEVEPMPYTEVRRAA